METDKPQSTRQLLVKIPNYPCLYRHSVNDTYYGIKKFGGKRKEHSLETRDRKIAERRLKDWIANFDCIDPTLEKTTLEELLNKFESIRKGMSRSTEVTELSMIKVLKETWTFGLNIHVNQIKPSMLDGWLAEQERRLKNSSYNRYTLFLKQLFELAVGDKIIVDSPFAKVKRSWKKPQKPIRMVPTQEQFQSIIASVRSQRFNAEAEESADLIEFWGLAGLGQAEVSSLEINSVDWIQKKIRLHRRKTGELYHVPIYAHLEPLLKKLWDNAVKAERKKLFTISDAKKSLANACTRLEYPQFTPRNIRQVLIRRLWQSGVDYKLISKWQGHQDGGKLILDTYTEVFGANDKTYEQQQLAKIL